MAILTDPPEWEVPGTKPPQNIIKDVGWEVGSRPPAPWWNWFFYTVAKSLRELETATLARIINEAGVPGIMAGPESERPAASPLTIGRIFIATDTKRIFRDRGDGWDQLSTPEAIGAPTLTQFANHVSDNNNPHQVTAAQLGLGDVLTNLAQILGSRIVDHNLDVADSPNGWYVRWDNGVQLCMINSVVLDQIDGAIIYTAWIFPAQFSVTTNPYPVRSAVAFDYENIGVRDVMSPFGNPSRTNPNFGFLAPQGTTLPPNARIHNVSAFAIGRWK